MLQSRPAKSRTHDMTEGSIVKQILLFSVPLMIGNVFQMLYNTVDSIVVGQFVGKEALAAVGSTTMIVNMLVFFFNGFSTGAGVVIARHFGAHDQKRLHAAVETTMALTFLFCIAATVIGLVGVKPMLRFMDTPEDVFPGAVIYLRIYFAGFAGLLIYNMGSGVLRAVGDTFRPLLFLIFTSILNTLLDLLFVVGFHMGIDGVAWATIIAQAVSAVLILVLLTRTTDACRLVWRDLGIDKGILGNILAVGTPMAIQSTITAFSNVFVQSYINYFGSAVMAGWSCYNKLDSFIFLPMSSIAMAATTFVSQNIGAGKESRANKGTVHSLILTEVVTGGIAVFLFIFASPTIRLFSQDAAVIEAGRIFLQTNVFFLLFNCVNHVLAAALRGRGDSRGPMIIMLATFVGVRQVYLYVLTHFIANTARLVGFGYPVGWMCCCVVELVYFYYHWLRKGTVSRF